MSGGGRNGAKPMTEEQMIEYLRALKESRPRPEPYPGPLVEKPA